MQSIFNDDKYILDKRIQKSILNIKIKIIKKRKNNSNNNKCIYLQTLKTNIPYYFWNSESRLFEFYFPIIQKDKWKTTKYMSHMIKKRIYILIPKN